MFLENLNMAFSSLRAAKLRSFLTMLGIIIGVAAVVAILSIGAGVKKSVQDQVTGVVNANAVAIASGKVGISKNGQSNAASSFGSSTLTQKDVSSLASIEHVTAVAPLSLVSGLVNYGSATGDGTTILATTPAFKDTQNFKLSEGAFFDSSQNAANVVVLGSDAKTGLFGASPALGKTITIRNKSYSVVGVVKSAHAGAANNATGGGGFDNAVFIPIDSAIDLNAGSAPSIVRILVQTDDAGNVNAAAEKMKATLLKNHGGQEDFTVLTQKDILGTIDTILTLLTTFIVAIAAISLLVGGIGIMNIMLVSVTERTREIGLRKAIGAPSSTVLGQFLIEAIVLSSIGGLLGIAVAFGIATVAGKLANIVPIFTAGSILLAVGVSAAVGIIFGIAPAIKAARKRPIDALRHE
jgi:putative ABC transport system permease protein